MSQIPEPTYPVPLKEWNRYFDYPTVPALRWIRFNQTANGFDEAFIDLGGRVLIDPSKFWECVRRNKGKSLGPRGAAL